MRTDVNRLHRAVGCQRLDSKTRGEPIDRLPVQRVDLQLAQAQDPIQLAARHDVDRVRRPVLLLRLVVRIGPVVESAGLEFVEASLGKEGGRRVLRVTVDREGGVDLDTISRVSDQVSRPAKR